MAIAIKRTNFQRLINATIDEHNAVLTRRGVAERISPHSDMIFEETDDPGAELTAYQNYTLSKDDKALTTFMKYSREISGENFDYAFRGSDDNGRLSDKICFELLNDKEMFEEMLHFGPYTYIALTRKEGREIFNVNIGNPLKLFAEQLGKKLPTVAKAEYDLSFNNSNSYDNIVGNAVNALVELSTQYCLEKKVCQVS